MNPSEITSYVQLRTQALCYGVESLGEDVPLSEGPSSASIAPLTYIELRERLLNEPLRQWN